LEDTPYLRKHLDRLTGKKERRHTPDMVNSIRSYRQVTKLTIM
jgi:hypothetical protein